MLGLVDGGMGAFPDSSFTFFCQKNNTAARSEIGTMITYFS